MGENSVTNGDQKLSVLDRLRQLKKEHEQPQSSLADGNSTNGESVRMEFQAIPKLGGSYSRKRKRKDSPGENCPKKVALDVNKGQSEVDCGITEFLRDGPGFQVILKSRFTDFQVNEIDTEGNIVRLTCTKLTVPSTVESEIPPQEDELDVLTPEQWKTLQNIIDNKLTTTLDIDVTDEGKDRRQQIHKAVKRKFGAHVSSNTRDVEGRKITVIGFATHARDCRNSWPKGRPPYLHFVLFKMNCDVTTALNTISNFIHIRSNMLGFAGTKDKRAATTQQVCVRKCSVEKFKECHKLRGMAVGNFCYKDYKLRLGDLKGNRFKIALRNVTAADEVVKDAIEHLQNVGFINYFGLQRFGNSPLVPTYAVGKAILKGDWQEAVELILKPRPGESSFADVTEAREIWWETRNATDALKPLTRKDKSIEGKLLMGLKKNGPRAFQNAFDSLPKQIVTMYLHSYQSLVWNKVVSRRIREFGLKVLPGDLVKATADITMDDHNDSGDLGDSGDEEDQAVSEFGEGRVQVRALSEQEAAQANIYDVLYPLPGDDVQLPDNLVGEWYRQLLHDDNFSMSTFASVNKKYGMYGSYRPILQKPEDVQWHTLQYSDPDQDLLQTELDALKGLPPPTIVPDGPYKAVVLEISLSVCCYATMAVRELAKCDTATRSQSLLTHQARQHDLARINSAQQTDTSEGACKS